MVAGRRIQPTGAMQVPRTIWLKLPWYLVAPLVVIGTRDASRQYNLAPKHMALPMGWENYFGFVCTPKHSTYQNIKRAGSFTVTYPRPTQVVLTSLSAAPRDDDDLKPSLLTLETFPAKRVTGPFVKDGYVFLECVLERFIDGFGENSLIVGQVIAAHVHHDALRTSERDDGNLILDAPLLSYLEPGRFTRIENTCSFPFPADFKR